MQGLAAATDSEIDRFVMGKLRKIQAEGFQMPDIDKATDGEIAAHVSRVLRRIHAEGLGMPNVDMATDGEIAAHVTRHMRRIQAERSGMHNVEAATDAEIALHVTARMTTIRVDAVDELTDRLIESLPPTHRLHNFRSDIPAWLEEIDESVNKARCNKFERSEHMLTNFGIHAQPVFVAYRVQLNKACVKARNETMDHIQAKFVHLTRHPFPLEDRIHELVQSNSARSNDSIVAAIRARSHICEHLLFIDRICTWVYWTAEQHAKRHTKNTKKIV